MVVASNPSGDIGCQLSSSLPEFGGVHMRKDHLLSKSRSNPSGCQLLSQSWGSYRFFNHWKEELGNHFVSVKESWELVPIRICSSHEVTRYLPLTVVNRHLQCLSSIYSTIDTDVLGLNSVILFVPYILPLSITKLYFTLSFSKEGLEMHGCPHV